MEYYTLNIIYLLNIIKLIIILNFKHKIDYLLQ